MSIFRRKKQTDAETESTKLVDYFRNIKLRIKNDNDNK